jgi:hypothetical protein
MGIGRVPGSAGGNDAWQQLASDVLLTVYRGISCVNGAIPGSSGLHSAKPVTIAGAGKGKPKAQATNTAQAKVTAINLHFYLPITVKGDKPGKKGFSADDFFHWLLGKSDDFVQDANGTPVYQQGYWEDQGVTLDLKQKTDSGVADFKRSLQQPNTIVVYLGHSTLDKNNSYHSMGLTPHGNALPEIPTKELRTLLAQSKASLVILCSCDSLTAAGKISGGPAVIATDSGPDRETNTKDWANALGPFLFALIGLELDGGRQPNRLRKGGHATIQEALDIANKEFADGKTGDSFKLVNGDGSVKLIP